MNRKTIMEEKLTPRSLHLSKDEGCTPFWHLKMSQIHTSLTPRCRQKGQLK